jgi:hypothetical protein
MRRIGGLALIAAAFLLAAPAALAEGGDGGAGPKQRPWVKAWVQFGAFLTDVESSFRIGVDNIGLGINLNVEKFLGLDSTNRVFRFDGGWRLSRNRRHTIDVSWFNLNRQGDKVLTEDLDIDGTTIIRGAAIESIYKIDIVKVRYDYSFVLDERVDLNVGGGLYVMPIELGIGEKGKDVTKRDITAPLPVVSLGFDFALTQKWFLRQDIDLMYLSISGVTGTILDLNAGVERNISKHLALGLGVERLSISIDAESGSDYPGLDFVGQVGFNYIGAQFYLKGLWR